MNNFTDFLNYLRPTFFANSIDDINLDYLKQIGIKYIFCDLDNTLIPYFCKLPSSLSNNFINAANEKGFKFFIISNNKKERVSNFCESLNITDFVYSAKKPFLGKLKRMIKKYDINKDKIIFIGDQFITDIFVANRLNIKSILILPRLDVWKQKKYHNFIISFIENFIYKSLAKNKMLFNDNYYDNLLKHEYEVI